MAVPCQSISKLRSAVNSIDSSCCLSRSRRRRSNGTRCLPSNKLRRQRQRRCCSTSRASALSSPPSSGRKDCAGTSTIVARSLLSQGSRRHPGEADRSIANRACLKQATHDCDQRSSSSLGYGCAISHNRSWLCGLKSGSANGGRLKKTTIVAMARKLLVALWKYVTAGIVIEGAVMKAARR
jgi:hypothetical protein